MRKVCLFLGILAACGILAELSFGGSDTYRSSRRVPTFTLDQAIFTALQRNPTLLNAEQEIKRTKGVIIQVRAQALPQVTARAHFEWTDPNLSGARIFGNTTGTSTTSTTPSIGTGAASLFNPAASQVKEVQVPFAAQSPTPIPITNVEQSDISYSISVTGTQLIFNGT